MKFKNFSVSRQRRSRRGFIELANCFWTRWVKRAFNLTFSTREIVIPGETVEEAGPLVQVMSIIEFALADKGG